MDITIKENTFPTNKEESNKLNKTIIGEIELDFALLQKIIPNEIKDEIIILINKFTLITKTLEETELDKKIGNLNSLINQISAKIKSIENINIETKKLIKKIRNSMYKINTAINNPSIITKTYKNGKFMGEYLNEKREGKGIYIFNNGDKYEGQYKNDLKNGYGIYIYKNGDTYKGYFKDDNYEGKGLYKYSNGDIYEGEYKNDLRDGQGIYTYKKGNKYEGQWKEGKKHGKGIFIYKNGNKYIGEFNMGQKEGSGEFI